MTKRDALDWIDEHCGPRMGLTFETPDGFRDITLRDDEILVEEPRLVGNGALRRRSFRRDRLAENMARWLPDVPLQAMRGIENARQRIPDRLTDVHALLDALEGAE